MSFDISDSAKFSVTLEAGSLLLEALLILVVNFLK